MLMLLLACRPTVAPPVSVQPGSPAELGPGSNVVVGDLDGDGVDEVFGVVDGVLHGPGGPLELGGAFQATTHGDLDGDGKEEILIASGMNRDQRSAPARITSFDGSNLTILLEMRTVRAQVTELQIIDGRVWAALFTEQMLVTGGWVEDKRLTEVASGALASRQLPVDRGTLVARVYGDEPKSDGDLALVDGDARTLLPSVRGARSLAVGDLNGDGAAEVLAGDGWHYDYGKQAVARVSLLAGPQWTEGRTIAHFPDDYSVRQLEIGEIDGQPVVLATGTRSVFLLSRDDLGWRAQRVGPVTESGNAAFIRTPDGVGVALAGTATASGGAPATTVPLVRK